MIERPPSRVEVATLCGQRDVPASDCGRGVTKFNPQRRWTRKKDESVKTLMIAATTLLTTVAVSSEPLVLTCSFANASGTPANFERELKEVIFDVDEPSLRMRSDADEPQDWMKERDYNNHAQLNHKLWAEQGEGYFVGAGWRNSDAFSFAYDGHAFTFSTQSGGGAAMYTWVCD